MIPLYILNYSFTSHLKSLHSSATTSWVIKMHQLKLCANSVLINVQKNNFRQWISIFALVSSFFSNCCLIKFIENENKGYTCVIVLGHSRKLISSLKQYAAWIHLRSLLIIPVTGRRLHLVSRPEKIYEPSLPWSKARGGAFLFFLRIMSQLRSSRRKVSLV